MKNLQLIIAAIVGILLLLGVLGALLFFNRAPSTSNSTSTGGLEVGRVQTSGTVGTENTGSQNQVTPLGQGENTKQRVFKISDGPVTGATFVQTFLPTTTHARYVLQENGHVMDQALDVPGSLPKAVSNTTIPGTAYAVWSKNGGVVYLQYLDNSTVKTISLVFPVATSSKSVTRPVQIQFLPDNITSLAVSPSGTQVAYLLANGKESSGYVVNTDGSNSKKLFSIGFSEILLSWPSINTLLLTTKSAAGVPGAVFSADIRTGGIVPLIYANGLTATANAAFSHIVYQTATGGSVSSYLHNMQRGTDIALSFDPIPEKCVWGVAATSTLYCAAPLEKVPNYLDLWHLGAASVADSLVSFTPTANTATDVLAVPGSKDGGVASDILELAVSADEKYLLFVKKQDRSLWGVRLGQN